MLTAVLSTVLSTVLLTGCAVLPLAGGGGDADDLEQLEGAAAAGHDLVRRTAPAIDRAVPGARWAGLESAVVSCGGGGLGSASRWRAGGDLIAREVVLDDVGAALEELGLSIDRSGGEIEVTGDEVDLSFVAIPGRGGDVIGRFEVTSGCASPGQDEVEELDERLRVDYAEELGLALLR